MCYTIHALEIIWLTKRNHFGRKDYGLTIAHRVVKHLLSGGSDPDSSKKKKLKSSSGGPEWARCLGDVFGNRFISQT